MSRVFDPYFSTKKNKNSGTGLYMSSMIAENHLNGEITVANAKQGACFTLRV